MRRLAIFTPLLVAAPMVFGQAALPVPDEQVKRTMPNDTKEMIDTEYKKLYEQKEQETAGTIEENERLRKELEALKNFNAGSSNPTAPAASAVMPGTSESKSPAVVGNELGNVSGNQKKGPKRQVQTQSAPTKQLASGVQVFAVSSEAANDLTVLPAGSWVRAKLLTGVQANARYAYNVLMQLDYAYTGPNGSKIPLQGCLVIGGAVADLSIERIIISPHTISCVRDNGEAFQRKVEGFVAGKDSSNGLTGVYDSKQGKVFLQAVLAGVVKGASEAYEIANTDSQVVTGAFGSQSVAKNFKGKFQELAVAKGVGGAAEMVTNWYLEQAKALLPTIHAGSGQDVWIVVTDRVDVPDLRANR
jgi:type IV secretory pathway VirB10-like protein